MDWSYVIAMLVITVVVNLIAGKVKSRKRAPARSPGPAPQKSVQVITCGKCGGELRRGSLPHNVTFYGSPIRQCPHCHTDYIDQAYRELALGGLGSGDARFDAGSRELEEAASRRRLSDSGYIHRLYISDYCRKSPQNAEALRKLAIHRVQPLLDRMNAVTDLRFQEFRVRNADAIIDRLNYEAHDPAAVQRVVQEVLGHYGIDRADISVQVDYSENQIPQEGGTLGTFTAIGSGGRVRIVIDPQYSDYDTVIGVVLHECAHAFLNARRIRCPDTNENERLTDVAAIYMGGGKYILRGYYLPNGHRVGYLSQVESEAAQKLVAGIWADRARQEADERRQIEEEWSKASAELRALVASIEAKSHALHPGRVVRESSIQAEFYELWQSGEAKRQQAVGLLNRVSGAKPKDEALRQAIDDARNLAAPLREFQAALNEWEEAETYQASLPDSAMEIVRGIGPLIEQGNAFAMLEMMRLWNGVPATRRDAQVYYRRLLAAGDAQSLCALGICSREGLCAAQSEAEARIYFQRAAALGSPDAKRLLGEG